MIVCYPIRLAFVQVCIVVSYKSSESKIKTNNGRSFV